MLELLDELIRLEIRVPDGQVVAQVPEDLARPLCHVEQVEMGAQLVHHGRFEDDEVDQLLKVFLLVLQGTIRIDFLNEGQVELPAVDVGLHPVVVKLGGALTCLRVEAQSLRVKMVHDVDGQLCVVRTNTFMKSGVLIV